MHTIYLKLRLWSGAVRQSNVLAVTQGEEKKMQSIMATAAAILEWKAAVPTALRWPHNQNQTLHHHKPHSPALPKQTISHGHPVLINRSMACTNERFGIFFSNIVCSHLRVSVWICRDCCIYRIQQNSFAEYWTGILFTSAAVKHLNPHIEKVYLMFTFT